MPYMKQCTKCEEIKSVSLFRFKRDKKRPNGYYLPSCKKCGYEALKVYRKRKPELIRDLLHKSYMKTSEGKVSRRNVLGKTEEERIQWHRDKSNRRCTRAKLARFEDEFTKFVTREAHELRKLRNKLTNIEWHVDHIIPLKGKLVCGLHIWSNLAVIPKVENLRKGNNHPVF